MVRRLVMIDHEDSFTDLIVDYFRQLNCQVCIYSYDDPILQNLAALQVDAVILSPGPGHPREVDASIQCLYRYHQRYPFLGICLGMQLIAEAFGGVVQKASCIMHGQQSMIEHTGDYLFQSLPSTFMATRYHSLCVNDEKLPSILKPFAWAREDIEPIRTLMALKHRDYPIFGIQFHPESILSEYGHKILSNFLLYV